MEKRNIPFNKFYKQFNVLSLTLIYGALISASNSIWGYQIVRYIVKGKFNLNIFMIAIWTSLFLFVLMIHLVCQL